MSEQTVGTALRAVRFDVGASLVDARFARALIASTQAPTWNHRIRGGRRPGALRITRPTR